MSDTQSQPSWMKFADFQGPTEAQEREAINRHTHLGKLFKRGRRDVLRTLTSADRGAGQWGSSTHRTVYKTRY